jgi:hypothetical protein
LPQLFELAPFYGVLRVASQPTPFKKNIQLIYDPPTMIILKRFRFQRVQELNWFDLLGAIK